MLDSLELQRYLKFASSTYVARILFKSCLLVPRGSPPTGSL